MTKKLAYLEMQRSLQQFEDAFQRYRSHCSPHRSGFGREYFLQHTKTRLQILLLQINEVLEFGDISDYSDG